MVPDWQHLNSVWRMQQAVVTDKACAAPLYAVYAASDQTEANSQLGEWTVPPCHAMHTPCAPCVRHSLLYLLFACPTPAWNQHHWRLRLPSNTTRALKSFVLMPLAECFQPGSNSSLQVTIFSAWFPWAACAPYGSTSSCCFVACYCWLQNLT